MELELSQAVDLLRRTPDTLRSLLRDLPDHWLHASEGPDTFTPHDVVGHLLDGEETDWIPRALIILEHGETQPFAPFDRFAFKAKYGDRPIGQLLDRFAMLRRGNLERLEGLRLGPDRLDLRGTHPALGQVTLRQLLATWVVHDLGHLYQIVRVMARQYQQAVGPWAAYLRILQP